MNIFDMIGPIMIGPSSSHTAGAVRIGRIARLLLGETPVQADIYLHGSFAKTYQGHGTDKALIAGLLNCEPDDARIRESLSLAEKQGLNFSFFQTDLGDAHPNTVRLELSGINGAHVHVQGSSIGGGNVIITKVDDMPVKMTGQYPTLMILHHDEPGLIADVTQLIRQEQINICSFQLSRDQKGGTAVMCLEMDNQPSKELAQKIRRLSHVFKVIQLDLS